MGAALRVADGSRSVRHPGPELPTGGGGSEPMDPPPLW